MSVDSGGAHKGVRAQQCHHSGVSCNHVGELARTGRPAVELASFSTVRLPHTRSFVRSCPADKSHPFFMIEQLKLATQACNAPRRDRAPGRVG